MSGFFALDAHRRTFVVVPTMSVPICQCAVQEGA
jgi:hypothetical protein